MILAIDIGNSEADFGLWDGTRWLILWHRATNELGSPDELKAWLSKGLEEENVTPRHVKSIYASVVPRVNSVIELALQELTGTEVVALWPNSHLDFAVKYDPPESAGADRIANALGASARFEPPIIVIDFGTATTFDVVNATGAFVGGAIMPGFELFAAVLDSGTAQLPSVPLEAPPKSIGGNTVHAIQSGLVFGYASGVEGLARQIAGELGTEPKIVATGGFGARFAALCPSISGYVPMLTLEGLAEAAKRLGIR